MRQGQQQNRQRSRGRGNNNRNNNNRNQLNRSMESNGPDVRIRGTAAHIAEKYAQLANDAQTAGDTVSAQSYWQFAEHYNRLVAIAQAAQQQAREEQEARREARGESKGDQDGDGDDNRQRNRRERGRNKGRNNEDNESSAETAEADVVESQNGEGPQPTIEDMPAEVVLNEKPVDAVSSNEDDSAPKKIRRPRKPKADVAAPVSDEASALPAFVTGAE